jgi:hypothetical protein
MRSRSAILCIALSVGWLVSGQEGDGKMSRKTVPAVACDHRYGAEATWSQGTDTSQLNSFWWAEACAFRENLALTVFDNPFSDGRIYIPVSEREEAAKTGRLHFQLYFTSDRWQNPKTGAFEIIPDYYREAWTQAGVEAGFKVEPGNAKRTRFPNHGQQMFDVSGGAFGYDVKHGKPGRQDVLSGLLKHEMDWLKQHVGPCSAAGYRNGQTGAAYAMPGFLLGVRNSAHNGDLSYGRSPSDGFVLGTGRYPDFMPKDTASMPLTTRAGDIDQSREQVEDHCRKLLAQAIATHGWYRDFNHWHTSPRFGLSLEQFLAEQRRDMADHDVVSLDFGQALQHKFLRDMARVSAHETEEGIQIDVTFRDPYGALPLSAFHIPLSVRVELAGTKLADADVASPQGCAIRRLHGQVVVVDVPFSGQAGTVTIELRPTDKPHYIDLAKPRVLHTEWADGKLTVETDRPTRLAVFGSPKGKGMRGVRPLVRDHALTSKHVVPLAANPDQDLYVGTITEWDQSVLIGPLAPGK